MRKTPKIALAAAGALALLLPASPAHAASSLNGCFASPGTPYIYYTATGAKRVAASMFINCQNGSGGTFTIHKQIREADATFDETVGYSTQLVSVQAGTTVRAAAAHGPCSNWDPTGAEEIYARAKLSVYVDTSWHNTPQYSMSC